MTAENASFVVSGQLDLPKILGRQWPSLSPAINWILTAKFRAEPVRLEKFNSRGLTNSKFLLNDSFINSVRYSYLVESKVTLTCKYNEVSIYPSQETPTIPWLVYIFRQGTVSTLPTQWLNSF